MRYLVFVSLIILLASCEVNTFESDKRQIMAKDQLRSKLRGALHFSITGFREDTLHNWRDSLVTNPIRYTLDIILTDSSGTRHGKKGIVIFTPSGNAILHTEITDRPLTDK